MDKDYKKLYEEALKRARDLHDNHPLGQPQTWMTCEKIFPELRESEDEKIRKALIQNLKERFGTKGNMGKGLDMPDVLTWLEKQGEQPCSSIEETELNSLAFLTELGYTCIPPKKEQQPEGWSEEDEEYYMIVKESILERWKGTDNKELIEIRNDALNWLKYLKPCWKLTDGQMKEALQTEYEKGRFDMQQEMMKTLIGGEVVKDIHNQLSVKSEPLNNAFGDIKFGEKVKIIIVKTEQQ